MMDDEEFEYRAYKVLSNGAAVSFPALDGVVGCAYLGCDVAKGQPEGKAQTCQVAAGCRPLHAGSSDRRRRRHVWHFGSSRHQCCRYSLRALISWQTRPRHALS